MIIESVNRSEIFFAEGFGGNVFIGLLVVSGYVDFRVIGEGIQTAENVQRGLHSEIDDGIQCGNSLEKSVDFTENLRTEKF